MGKKKNQKSQSASFLNNLGYWMIYIMIGIIPHIYYYMGYKTKINELKYFPDTYYADLYMLGKSKMFLVLTIVLLCIFIIQIIGKKISFIKDKVSIAAGIFGVVVVVSSLTSDYQDIVYWGAKDRNEGMWVWLSYIVLFLVVRHYARDKNFVNKSLKILVYSTTIMGVFGLMQLFGYDIYTQGPLKWLCFPKEIATNIEMYMTTNTTDLLIVGALYNSNYFGAYLSVAILGSLAFLYNVDGKRRYGMLLLVVINYAAMIASGSEAALLGFSTAIIVFVVYNGDKLLSNRYTSLMVILSLLCTDRMVVLLMKNGQSSNAKYIYFILFLSILSGCLINKFLGKFNDENSTLHKSSGLLATIIVVTVILIFNLGYNFLPTTVNHNTLNEFVINENIVQINYENGNDILLDFSEEGIIPYNDHGEVLKHTVNEDGLLRIKVDYGPKHILEYDYYDLGYSVKYTSPINISLFYDGENVHYRSIYGGMSQIEYPDRFNFYYKNSRAFSNRGYIWGTYLPVGMDNFLLGTGVDTYMAVFPQEDYVGKSNNFPIYLNHTLIDKPHSLYLDIFLSFGIIGLLLLILMIIAMVKKIIRLQIIDKGSESMLMIVVALLVSGIFNDSVIPLTIILTLASGIVLEPNSKIDKL